VGAGGGAAEKPNTLAFIVLIWDYIAPLGRAYESQHKIARQPIPLNKQAHPDTGRLLTDHVLGTLRDNNIASSFTDNASYPHIAHPQKIKHPSIYKPERIFSSSFLPAPISPTLPHTPRLFTQPINIHPLLSLLFPPRSFPCSNPCLPPSPFPPRMLVA
jgi:hypothetical protein